jgi:hypothetical protein
MFSLKTYIRSLLKRENSEMEINSTLFDKFYAENTEFIDSKILELWEHFKYEQDQASENKNHYSSN